MTRTLRIDRVLPHSPERVWQAVSDREMLAAWFMDNDFEPTLGRRFTFRMKPQRGWDGVTHCEVIEFAPPHRLAFSYRGRATGEKALACAGLNPAAAKAGRGIFAELDTVLRFSVAAERSAAGEEQTRLRLEHSGFRGIKGALVSVIMGFGWRKLLDRRLPAALEGRRTATRVCGTEES
jgi:uncharacterized protein YndB with AHSA1/START domain